MVKQMFDLIERNKVIRYLRDEVSLGTFMKRTIANADGACWSICDGIANDIPTVDAEPVRHGKWIDIDLQMYTWKVRCDQCGHERSMMSTQGRYPKYCENCGARMDGK